MTAQHTPGPWNVSGQPIEFDEAIVADGPIAIARLPRAGQAALNGQMGANARLIAAAPDLLDALQYIVNWQTSPDKWNPETARDMARAAIAKATAE